MSYVNRNTGEVVKVQTFVACLPASDYGFMICVPSQSTEDFVYTKFSEGHAGEGEEIREMVETMKTLRKMQGEAGGDCGGIKYSMGEGVKRGKAYV